MSFFTPTFTQGLILGQLSILVLLGFILKYLFLDNSPRDADGFRTVPTPPFQSQTLQQNPNDIDSKEALDISVEGGSEMELESAEWFNALLEQIVRTYRAQLHSHLDGPEGDEAARSRVERWANEHRGSDLIDPIRIHSVDLGSSAPRFSNARTRGGDLPENYQSEFDLTYTDTISLSLSTSILFNYPTASFARLPISLSLSLSVFSSVVTLTGPSPSTPSLSFTLHPNFTLSLKQSSLLGSRAKLADVPKVHQMIEARIRSYIQKSGVWRVLLPGVATELKE